MLRRATRRFTAKPRCIPPTDLYLPWLCPALGNRRVQSRWSSENSSLGGMSLRTRRNSRNAGLSASARRSLATHVDADFHQPDIPWDFEINPNLARPAAYVSDAPKLDVTDALRLRPFDPQKILMASDATALPEKRYKAQGGVGGDISEMYAVLQGCLSIGRLDRAEAIIKRLSKLDIPMSELMTIHTEFVRVSTERIVSDPRDSDIQALHKWFELRIRGDELDFDYAILAYMLKASLRESSDKKRSRLVRRYLELLPPDESEDLQRKFEVLMEREEDYGILTGEELELLDCIIEERKTNVILKANQDARETGQERAGMVQEFSDAHSKVTDEDTPEIIATEQKGLGLKSLKNVLSIFTKPPGFESSQLTYEQQLERQIQLEESSVRAALDRWREENDNLVKMGMSTATQTKNLGARMWKWQLSLEMHLKKELERIDEMGKNPSSRVGSELEEQNIAVWARLLPIEQLAAITIISTMSRITRGGVDAGLPLAGLIVHVGRTVEDEYLATQIKDATKKDPTFANQRREKFLIKLLKSGRPLPSTDDNINFPNFKTLRWPATTHARLGAFLVGQLIKSAVIPVTRVNPVTEDVISQLQPAFSRITQVKNGKKIGVLITNSALVDQLKREPLDSLLAQHLPMVVQPAPWTAFDVGGFLAHPAKAIRLKNGDKDQRHYADIAIERGDMKQVLKGLDVLGRQSWRINKPVLDVMVQAWNTGQKFAKIPPANPEFKTPVPPTADDDPLKRTAYHKETKAMANQKASIHSQRCYQNFQLEIARAYKDEVFWFPHNMDFRGRAYPIPPIFNHMGADHCRGLLLFGEARELGAVGLRWLKIHLANVFGYDKASLSERERFADEHRDDIYDSASNPLHGKGWWRQSDDAWQTLAACIELKKAWDCPDATKFMSSLAVHQDGTCNGLQHYAALGGDEWGAKQVNLEPGDKPSDIYTAVAELVKEQIAEDTAKGHPNAQYLNGRINRKIVKQTVMTNVYGVTWLGARDQVAKQLSTIEDLLSDPKADVNALAGYIATKIFNALGTMFGGAHHIQNWLGDCANRISSSITADQMRQLMQEHERALGLAETSALKTKIPKLDITEIGQFKSPVIWTTPLQMPVVQPYRASKSRRILTCLQGVSLSEPHRSDPVSKRKQLQGFPPNFVHSLDATHMMLSALKCHELGLNFAAVHDSFWTHAADVDKMNQVLRDAFIRIHSEDVINRMAAEFEIRYKGSYHLVSYKRNSPATNKILEYRKSKAWRDLKEEILGSPAIVRRIFSDTKSDRQIQELIIEKTVADWEQSDDPELVAKAQKTMTPGRLFLLHAAEEDIEVPEEFAELGMGSVPSAKGKPSASGSAEMVDLDSEAAEAVPSEIAGDDELVAEEEIAEENSENEPPATKERGNWFTNWATGRIRRSNTQDYQTTVASHVWVPLKFPAVPKKGKFDVSRLKDSAYFFS